MFTQEDINRRVDEILSGPMPPMQVLSYDGPMNSEAAVIVCRGDKADFDDVLHFWIKARQQRKWWDRWGDGEGYGHEYENYVVYANVTVKDEEPMQYTDLSQEEFYKFFNMFTEEKFHPLLSSMAGIEEIRESYVAGVSAEAKWNSRSAVGEFEHDFVAFHWATTA